MTTIAIDKTYLVTDSRQCQGEVVINDEAKKIHELSSMVWRYAAFCGDLSNIQDVLHWLNQDVSGESPDGDWAAILIDNNGDAYELFAGCKLPNKVMLPYFQGSGANLAKAAYSALTKASEIDCSTHILTAVQVAIDLDIHSGGEVQYVNYKS